MQNGAEIDASRLNKKQVLLQFNYENWTQTNYQITSKDTTCVVDIDPANVRNLLVSCDDLFGNWQPTNYRIR